MANGLCSGSVLLLLLVLVVGGRTEVEDDDMAVDVAWPGIGVGVALDVS